MTSTATHTLSSSGLTVPCYVVETTGKRRRYIRGIYDTLTEAEQHKSRIKARWQPTIHPAHGGPFRASFTYVPASAPGYAYHFSAGTETE